jgi:molybdopterin molybdotransferase
MITPDQAWRVILDHTVPLPTVTLKANEALGHFLAESVPADRDIPPVDRSAMDGFAVRAHDLQLVPVDLEVVGELAAGSDAEFRVGARSCVRIYTGAGLPPGADAVVMQEDTAPSDRPNSVRILKSVSRGANVFKRGENARKGDTLLAAGVRLDPAGLAVCAAVGCGTVQVHGRPRISVLSTGTELLDGDSHALPHQIRNSNGPYLRAALSEQSFAVTGYKAVGDELEEIVAALRRAAGNSTVVIVSGGISVGKYDLVPEAIRQSEGTIHYHGIAMKPGKPQLFASLAGGCLVFGLPGNPLSAMTGFHEFALPALRRLAGCAADRCRPILTVRLAQDISTKGDRHRLVPARLTWTTTGAEAVVVDARGTADLVAGARADGVLVVPVGSQHIPAGSFVGFRPWRTLP